MEKFSLLSLFREDAPVSSKPILTIRQDLVERVNKELCAEKSRTITQMTIEERYKDYLHIYTDGSKGKVSTSAASYVGPRISTS